MASDDASLESRVREKMQELWANVGSFRATSTRVPAEVRDAIEKSINSRTKTYRYVLPSQLLPKLIDSSLDCHAVQVGSALSGAFDARSIAQHVIVPFDRANNNVLGGSTEPYANNPLRIPALLPQFRPAQKDKAGFDALLARISHSADETKLPRPA